MSVSKLLQIDEQDKMLLWEIFQFEKMLDDHEALLLDDLEYYEKRIRAMEKAESTIEIGLLTIYMKHMKNIRHLLIKLQNNRNDSLKSRIEELTLQQTSD